MNASVPDTTIAEFGYVAGQFRDTFPSVLENYRQRSEAMAARADARLDIRYGVHPRQTFDLFPATGIPVGMTLVYFHAGYWQSRDKSVFRFIAESLNGAGLEVSVVNYPLCPDVSVPRLVQMASEALPRIEAETPASTLILAGHSAGAHIAVELASIAYATGIEVAAVVGISGVYDLRDLVDTSLNDKLRLDADLAAAASPVLRAEANMPPALFVVGEVETEVFRSQNRRMADAWRAAGNSCSEHVSAREDHFSILQNLVDPSHAVHAALMGLVHGAQVSAPRAGSVT